MVKLGIIQTSSFSSNEQGIQKVSELLKKLGKKETDIVCLPEQWLHNNKILEFEMEFSNFKIIAKDYGMTIIPGAFYERRNRRLTISSPVIAPNGEVVGRQEKIHPFDYEKQLIQSDRKTKIFKTKCKFGIVICYDMVFPEVAHSFVKKGADVLFSPSRIVRRGITPWQMYIQVRALENRVPILAANVQNRKFGGKSVIVDLIEKNQVMIPKILIEMSGQKEISKKFNLKKYQKSRKIRFSDSKKVS
ncbi:MAG TPA: carbon-nitrogen hydrolase family protein [Nitrosopumilaceae archaeon]|nr:carbon-nitrogen hydrolase family protein [Nitrosopumilaceae archaeon]